MNLWYLAVFLDFSNEGDSISARTKKLINIDVLWWKFTQIRVFGPYHRRNRDWRYSPKRNLRIDESHRTPTISSLKQTVLEIDHCQMMETDPSIVFSFELVYWTSHILEYRSNSAAWHYSAKDIIQLSPIYFIFCII